MAVVFKGAKRAAISIRQEKRRYDCCGNITCGAAPSSEILNITGGAVPTPAEILAQIEKLGGGF